MTPLAYSSAPYLDPGYIYAPKGWRDAWNVKLAASATGLARMGFIGDSVHRSWYASDLNLTTVSARLQTALQARYGDGGSGFKGAVDTQAFITSVAGAATGTYYAGKANNCPAETGTWAAGGGNWDGPGLHYRQTVVALSTVTYTNIRGTAIDIVTKDGGAGANLEYQIDGGGFTPINGVTAGNIVKTTVAVAAGAHTVVVRAQAGITVAAGVFGVTGRNATGVQVNNWSIPGGTLSQYIGWRVSDGVLLNMPEWNGGGSNPADMLVIDASANSWSFDPVNYTQAKQLEEMESYLFRICNAQPDTSLMFVGYPVGFFDNTQRPFAIKFYTDMRNLAREFNAAFVNAWIPQKRSYNYGLSQNYYGNAANPAIAGTDFIHLSDTGTSFIYNLLAPLLL